MGARIDVATALSRTVVFLFQHEPPPAHDPTPIGTAFVLGYPDPENHAVFIPLLVTARHNLVGKPKVILRYSSRGGAPPVGAVYDLDELRARGDIWEHADPGVDISILRTMHLEQTEYEPFPLSMVATRSQFSELDIKATDRVIYPTLLRFFVGKSRNYPVMRDGMIALIADEPIPVRSTPGVSPATTEQHVILVDGLSIPGASGCPVFLSPTPRRRKGNLDLTGTQPLLIGVMHGFVKSEPRGVVKTETEQSGFAYRENAGIAVVFPSWRILEILGGEQALSRLDEILAIIHRERRVPHQSAMNGDRDAPS